MRRLLTGAAQRQPNSQSNPHRHNDNDNQTGGNDPWGCEWTSFPYLIALAHRIAPLDKLPDNDRRRHDDENTGNSPPDFFYGFATSSRALPVVKGNHSACDN